jgi:hypothetical protein
MSYWAGTDILGADATLAAAMKANDEFIADVNAKQAKTSAPYMRASDTGSARQLQEWQAAEKRRQEDTARSSLWMQQEKPKLDAAAAQHQRAVKAMTAIMIGGAVGGVVGGAFGAWAWSAHRIWGFILASAFVGAPAGAGIGFVIGAREMAK